MKRIVVFNRITLDGFFAGPNGELFEWAVPDLELDQGAHEGNRVDTAIFGRVTYQMFESHWPNVFSDPNSSEADIATAQQLTAMTKIVFSTTLTEVTWENTQLFHGNLVKEVKNLKQGDGESIIIFGSGSIVQQLTAESLVDEFVLILTPVILGMGKPLFEGVPQVKLNLLEERSYSSGNILLRYGV
jgi:dihydrofolate reductase